MRASLLVSIALVGCGSDATAPPPGSNAPDGGVRSDAAVEPECLSDGWCSEPALSGSFYYVWASAPDDVWVLGSERAVHRYDGARWTTSQVPGEGPANGLFGRAANDVWVGLETSVKHFDGTSWTTEPVTPPSALNRFAVDEKGDVWARSYQGVYRREGTTWVAKLPDKTLDPVGRSIAGCDSKVWFPAGPLIEWDGTTFWQHGVTGEDDPVRAAGGHGAGKVWVSSRVLHRLVDGAFRADLLEGAPKGLFSMSVASDTEAWALGEGPLLASFDGTSWKTYPSVDVKDGFSVFASAPGVVRVMNENGSIVEHQPATSTKNIVAYVAGTTIVGAHPSASWLGAAEAYYNEDGRMWRWAEGSMHYSSRGTSHEDIRAIWAENGTSVWMAGGRKLRHFTGGTTTIDVATGITLEPDETYLNVGGTGSDDVWALTNKRNLHFTGGAWKAHPSGFSDADTVAHVVSFGADDAWVFRSRGRFTHFDGTSFRVVPQSPTFGLAGCAGGKELVAISQQPSRIYRGAPLAMTRVADLSTEYTPIDAWFGADGTAWIVSRDTIGTSSLSYFDGDAVRFSVEKTTRSMDAVWALPSGEAWAVGPGGLLHRKPD